MKLDDGQSDEKEDMFEWTLFQVALALKATKVTNFLLKDKLLGVIPRSDLSELDLQLDQSPHIVDGTDTLLELEMRPIRAILCKKDHKMLQRIWKKQPSWEPCHFYKLIELLIEQEDSSTFQRFIAGLSTSLTQFYEPSVLQ